MTFRVGRILSAIATLAVIGAGWYFAAPTQLGGSDSYVQIYGTSMNPRFHAGDLVVIRSASTAHVGDIVAYRNAQLGGQVVMHRIIRIAGDRYVFKGDNNSFIDSYRPTRGELVGRLWLHVPRAGSLLVWLHGRRLGLLAGIVALLTVLLGAGLGGTRLRRRHAGAPRPAVSPPSGSHGASGAFGPLAIGAGVALLACAALAAVSFTRPLTTHAVKQGIYTQTGRFSYDAAAPTGARIYGSTTVKTGQPLFLRLVHSANFHFAYAFNSATPHAVNGTIALDAVVTGSNGWKRTLYLVAPTPFSGDHTVVNASLSFLSLTKLLQQVDALTNTNGGTYTLALQPRIQVRGIVAGNALQDRFSPSLPLSVDATHVQLQSGGAAGPGASAALTQSVSGSGTVPAASRISLLKFKLSVSSARRVSLIGGALAAILLLLGVVLALRSSHADEAARIAREYGDLIVAVETLPASPAHVVRTSSMEGLARVAEQSGRMIMHTERAGVHTYFVEDTGIRYLYEHRSEDRSAEAAAIRLARPGA